jgi:hypothetical protein
MKQIIFISLVMSLSIAQQGLNLNDLDSGVDGKLMYPYSGNTFEYWPNGVI